MKIYQGSPNYVLVEHAELQRNRVLHGMVRHWLSSFSISVDFSKAPFWKLHAEVRLLAYEVAHRCAY